MWKRLTLFWTLLRGDARQLWAALRHPAAPTWLKVGTVLTVLYVLSPIDVIPDWIPFVGWMDDLAVVTFAIRWMLRNLPPEIAAATARRR